VNETVEQKVRRAGGIADAALKIAGALSMVCGVIAFVLVNSWTQEKVQGWLGITAMGIRLDKVEKRLPGPQIARYDPTYSEIVGPCHIGGICVARFRVQRTPYGADCNKPVVTPYVRNHGAVRHPAELLGGVIRAQPDEWDFLEIRFRAPANAKPGRAVYWSDQDYNCPFGSVDEKSDLIPFTLLAKKD